MRTIERVPSTRGGRVSPAARRDLALARLRAAKQQIEELTVELARRMGDPNAQRMVHILACFGPIIAAIEHTLPEASRVRRRAS